MTTFSVPKLNKVVPDAFHGTELSIARQIRDQQTFVIGKNEKLYLGDGAYFYEGSAELADIWARREGSRRGWQTYGVLQAAIQLGRCLDLNSPEHRRELEEWAEELVEQVKGIKDPKEVTPAWVINYFVKKVCKGKVDTIRCSYFSPEYGEVIPDSKIFRSRLVVCVRNPQNILKISLPIMGLVV
jgi:hypothetical protein